MKGFLDYSAGTTFFHRLDPLTKLIFSLSMCASCFISKNHFFILAVILINIFVSIGAGIADRAAGMLKGLIKISLILILFQIFFIRTGNVLLRLPLGLFITDNGISGSVLIVLRLIGATMPLALMLSVTQMNDLANVLCKKLFIPYKYAFTLTTAIRFIPIFSNEMSGIIEAQTARGVEFDTKNIFKKIGLILPLCVPLLISSVRKIDGSSVSAEIRGFELRGRKSCYKEYKMRASDFMMIFVSGAIIAASVLLNSFVLF